MLMLLTERLQMSKPRSTATSNCTLLRCDRPRVSGHGRDRPPETRAACPRLLVSPESFPQFDIDAILDGVFFNNYRWAAAQWRNGQSQLPRFLLSVLEDMFPHP